VIADGRPYGVDVAAGGDDVVAGGQGARAKSTPMPRPAPVINQVLVSVEVMAVTEARFQTQ
jgi:hypothetical protein